MENNGFRDVARVKQALSEEECLDILRKEVRGVLSVNGDNGYPLRDVHKPLLQRR